MAKVLSLMATHTGDRSQYNRSVGEIDDQPTNNEENKKYAGVLCNRCSHRLGMQVLHPEVADMFTDSQNKRCVPKFSHTFMQRKAYVWESDGWSMVFKSSLSDPMVSVRGIRSKLLSPRFLDPLYWLSMVLIHGFSKSLTIKRERRSFGYTRVKVEDLKKG